jgi:hypothetical protein
MIGYKKCPHAGQEQSQNILSIEYDVSGMKYDLTLNRSRDCVVSHRREMNMNQIDHYTGFLSLADLNRDTSSNEQINQPHAIIGIGFRLHEKVRVYDFFRHTVDSKSTTGHVVASMLGIQQGFCFARPWPDSPFEDWVVFLPAKTLTINGQEQGDRFIETINGNGLDDIIPLLPSIALDIKDDVVYTQLVNADGTPAHKKDIEIYLETTTGLLQETRLITNELGQAQTNLLFKGNGKVKAGFKFYTGKAEINV